MNDITREYLLLFNAITDAGEALRELQTRLMEAQQKAEALFLDGEPDTSISQSA